MSRRGAESGRGLHGADGAPRIVRKSTGNVGRGICRANIAAG